MTIGIVIIGRNEGERLRRCLLSAVSSGAAIVYVDSGSTDGSPALAKSLGASVVELDMSIPFTAARGRNAGFERLLDIAPETELVQFVDGDCEIRAGWIERASAELRSRSDVAVICGHTRERFPQASLYNRLCDIEWRTPAVGEARSSGGIAMMRRSAFQAVGGFDPTVAAGEEPELCARLRKSGWKILRIDAEMTFHDAAMLRFRQWWKRQYRGGYGVMDMVTRLGFANEPYYRQYVRSCRLWTVGWLLALAGALLAFLFSHFHVGALVLVLAVVALIPLQAMRIAWNIKARFADLPKWDSMAYGALTLLGKWPQVWGQIAYVNDSHRSRSRRLIEYK